MDKKVLEELFAITDIDVLYKRMMRLAHPDLGSPALTYKRTDLTKRINQAYKARDMDRLRFQIHMLHRGYEGSRGGAFDIGMDDWMAKKTKEKG